MESRPLIAGIYRVFAPETGESFLGFTYNFEGTRKRLRFELTLNACPYKPLQLFWNERGGLEFELLEAFAPEPALSELETEAHLRAKLFLWQERLGTGAWLLQTQM